MVYSLTWLADTLRKAGLNVVETTNWKGRGHGNVADIRGVLLHHTADGLHGNYPSLETVLKGRPGLPGPLANLGLGRDGTWYCIAAGKAYHAGLGTWPPMNLVNNGNYHLIGIEAENSGYINPKSPKYEPWGDTIMNSYKQGVAALLEHMGYNANKAIGHKEYAPNRKVDPTFSMPDFRADVQKILDTPSDAKVA